MRFLAVEGRWFTVQMLREMRKPREPCSPCSLPARICVWLECHCSPFRTIWAFVAPSRSGFFIKLMTWVSLSPLPCLDFTFPLLPPSFLSDLMVFPLCACVRSPSLSLSLCPCLCFCTTSLVLGVQVFHVRTVQEKLRSFGVVTLLCQVPLVGRVLSPRLPLTQGVN